MATTKEACFPFYLFQQYKHKHPHTQIYTPTSLYKVKPLGNFAPCRFTYFWSTKLHCLVLSCHIGQMEEKVFGLHFDLAKSVLFSVNGPINSSPSLQLFYILTFVEILLCVTHIVHSSNKKTMVTRAIVVWSGSDFIHIRVTDQSSLPQSSHRHFDLIFRHCSILSHRRLFDCISKFELHLRWSHPQHEGQSQRVPQTSSGSSQDMHFATPTSQSSSFKFSLVKHKIHL